MVLHKEMSLTTVTCHGHFDIFAEALTMLAYDGNNAWEWSSPPFTLCAYHIQSMVHTCLCPVDGTPPSMDEHVGPLPSDTHHPSKKKLKCAPPKILLG